MPNRYIVAMLANKEEYFVDIAQRNFKHLAQNYLLGDGVHAHITLLQFAGEEKDYLIVKDFLTNWLNKNKLYQPTMLGMQFGSDSQAEDILWAALQVEREATLVKLHLALLNLAGELGLQVFTKSGEEYNPHLTLARIKTKTIKCEKPELHTFGFTPAMGVADSYGQFIEVIDKLELPKPQFPALQMMG